MGEVGAIVAGEGAVVTHGGPVAPLQIERRELRGHVVHVDAQGRGRRGAGQPLLRLHGRGTMRRVHGL